MAQATASLDTAATATDREAMRADVVYDIEGLKALEDDWCALFAASATDNYFVSYDWCLSWLDAFGTNAGSRPVLITVRRGDRLIALLALRMHRLGPLKLAAPIGRDSGQYCDMLVAADVRPWNEVFDVLWKGIEAAGIDLLQFVNVRDDSPLAAFLATRRTIRSAPIHSCSLDTTKFADFEAYMASRSASLRKNMRRRRRKLEALGPVTYEVVTDPAQIDEIASTIVSHKLDWFENRRWHGRFLSRAGIGPWMADVARRALASGHLHLSLLRVGRRIVSAQLAFVCGKMFTAYVSSFDLAYSAYAVGRMQYEAFIEDLFPRGLQIDLMPRHDEFKLEWVDRGVATRGYAMPVTALGSAVALVQNPRNRAAARKAINFIYMTMLPKLRQLFSASKSVSPRKQPADPES